MTRPFPRMVGRRNATTRMKTTWRSVIFLFAVCCFGFASFIYFKSEIIPISTIYYNYDLNDLNEAFKIAFDPESEAESDETNILETTPFFETEARNKTGRKMEILMWTHRGRFGKIGDYIKQVHNICGGRCEITADRGRLGTADAVVFFPFYMKHFNTTYPPHANAQQLMTFWEQESPMRYMENKIDIPKGYFNTTVTYMLSSDVPVPYGHYVKKRQPGTRQEFRASLMRQLKNQKKGIFKVFSHCSTSSKREEIIKQIEKHIPVDLYGKCGNMTCSYSCFQKNKLLYRFYLSFENSICDDYITEKFYQFNTLVPIVMKRSLYPRLPEKSFIALDDYSTLKDFAIHINDLMKDDVAYADYLMWRYDYYRAKIQPTTMMCWLCDYVKTNEKFKSYDKIEGFSDATQSCDLSLPNRWLKS